MANLFGLAGRQVLLIVIFLFAGLYACVSDNAEEDIKPKATGGPSCPNSPEVFVNSTQGTDCGQKAGSITVTGSGGSGSLTYSIDGQSFQADGTFNNLGGGTYTVTVKDSEGCTNTQTATVPVTGDISLAKDVFPIVQGNCAISGCHVSGAQSPNLSTKASVLNNAGSIIGRAGNRSMPPASSGRSLSDSQIELIRCWVDGGAKDN